ncbi:tripartite tricarboxylate transporter substrate binding protein [Cupriavidus sp. L7L]|nr:tripartite tricarboxylate transporter substrate binding protein [Cupriavidus sp. L7L]
MNKRCIALLVMVLGIPISGHTSDGGRWIPTKPIRVVVPVAGTTNDVIAREVAAKISPALGQPVVVENKPGAGGNIGADAVAKAPADGYTLLVGYNGPIAINRSLFKNMPFDPEKDLAPITLAVTTPQYLVVNASLPVATVADLVALAKKSPGAISYGSIGPGSASHLTMEMFKSAAHVDMVHVPYRGSGAVITDLIAGNVKAAFLVPGNVQQFVKEGRLKVIATTGTRRFVSAPAVPTLIESGYPNFVATSWIGFLAPARTPQNVIARYNAEIKQALSLPDVQEKLRAMEFDVVGSSPEQFRDWIKADAARWQKVIRDENVKVE